MTSIDIFAVLDEMKARNLAWRAELESEPTLALSKRIFRMIDQIEDEMLCNRLSVALEILLDRVAPEAVAS